MEKKIIVGCGIGMKAVIESRLRDLHVPQIIELVEVDEKPPVVEELNASICMFDTKSTYMPFEPKKKHQPKGHERKYKYHP